jgi:hypothetical protein
MDYGSAKSATNFRAAQNVVGQGIARWTSSKVMLTATLRTKKGRCASRRVPTSTSKAGLAPPVRDVHATMQVISRFKGAPA